MSKKKKQDGPSPIARARAEAQLKGARRRLRQSFDEFGEIDLDPPSGPQLLQPGEFSAVVLDAEPEPARGRWSFVLGMEMPGDPPVRGHWKTRAKLKGAEFRHDVAAKLFTIVVHVELVRRGARVELSELRFKTAEELAASKDRKLEDLCTCGKAAALHGHLPPHTRPGCKGFTKA